MSERRALPAVVERTRTVAQQEGGQSKALHTERPAGAETLGELEEHLPDDPAKPQAA
ncbi:MAG: hypothetical protein ACRDL4_06255 [Thermoleophilaceae bacterium]